MRTSTFFLLLISLTSFTKSTNITINPFGSCRGGSLYVVAHPDDDLLFQSPDLIDDMLTGSFNRCITTIYLTSGDAGSPSFLYAQSRENGNQAATASIMGINNQWIEYNITLGSGQVTIHSLVGAEYIQKIWFRLPDGNVGGMGYSCNGYQTLRQLFFGNIGSINNVIGTSTFTLSSLKSTISSIITQLAPARIRTLDYLSKYDTGDHSDHYTTARITQSLASGAALTGYMGYPIQNFAPSLSASDMTAKANAFFTYTSFDPSECQSIPLCSGRGEASWLQRQYLTSPSLATNDTIGSNQSPVLLPINSTDLSFLATAYASSESPGQTPAAAIDGVISGYPGNYSAEWVSNGELIGAMLLLIWPFQVAISSFAIYDRPNQYDQITNYTLLFADQTIVQGGTLWNDGSATLIVLKATKVTTAVLLQVTAVSPTSSYIGLSEFVAYGIVCSDLVCSNAANPSLIVPQNTTSIITNSTIAKITTPLISNSTTLPTNSTLTTNSTLISSSLDLALSSTATASSSAINQGPEKGIDGILGGYTPNGGDFSKEWASQGQGIGATLKLTWTNSIIINQIVLFDRPNLDDQVLAATITFSDGSIISIPTLNNDGSATIINLTKAVNTTTLLFTITAVSASTSNIGLSEIQLYGPSVQSPIGSTKTPVASNSTGNSIPVSMTSTSPATSTSTANLSSTIQTSSITPTSQSPLYNSTFPTSAANNSLTASPSSTGSTITASSASVLNATSTVAALASSSISIISNNTSSTLICSTSQSVGPKSASSTKSTSSNTRKASSSKLSSSLKTSILITSSATTGQSFAKTISSSSLPSTTSIVSTISSTSASSTSFTIAPPQPTNFNIVALSTPTASQNSSSLVHNSPLSKINWSTITQSTGAWLQTNLTASYPVQSIVLSAAIATILNARIDFSDSTFIFTGAIGVGNTTINLNGVKYISSLRFTVLSVLPGVTVVSLLDLQMFNSVILPSTSRTLISTSMMSVPTSVISTDNAVTTTGCVIP